MKNKFYQRIMNGIRRWKAKRICKKLLRKAVSWDEAMNS